MKTNILFISVFLLSYFSLFDFPFKIDPIKLDKSGQFEEEDYNPSRLIIQTPTEDFIKVSKVGKNKNRFNFSVIDLEGSIRLNKEIEIEGLDRITSIDAILWTYDGGIIISGIGNPRDNQNAFLIKLDLKGNFIWLNLDIIDAQTKAEKLSLIQTNEDYLTVFVETKEKNSATYMKKVDVWDGHLLDFKRKKICNNCSISCIKEDPKGNLLIAGKIKPNSIGNNEVPYFIVADQLSGNEIESHYPLGKNTIGTAKSLAIDLNTGKIVITGEYSKGNSLSDLDIFIMFYDENYKKALESRIILGEPNIVEKVYSIVADHQGSYYLGGYTNRDGNSDIGFWIQIDSLGEEKNRKLVNYKSDIHSQVYKLFIHSNEELIVIGRSGDNFLKPTFESFNIKGNQAIVNRKIELGKIEWVEASPDDTLRSNERSVLKFKIRNPEVHPIQLYAQLEASFTSFGLEDLSNFDLGYIPGNSSKTFRLPLSASKQTLSGKIPIKLTIQNTNKETIEMATREINIKRTPSANLQFIDSLAYVIWKNKRIPFKSKNKADRRDLLTLVMPVKNTGDLTSKAVNANLYLPLETDLLDPSTQKTLPSIAPDETIEVKFNLKVGSYYPYDSVSLRSNVGEIDGNSGDYLNFILNLPNILAVSVLDTIYYMKNQRGIGGSNPPDPNDLVDPCDDSGIKISWVTDILEEYDAGVAETVNYNKVIVKAKINSQQPLSLKDTELVTGEYKRLIHGLNQDTCFLQLIRDTINHGQEFPYLYEYQNQVWLLEPGKGNQPQSNYYPFLLRVKKTCESYSTIKLKYVPIQVRINGFFIGVPLLDDSIYETAFGAEEMYNSYNEMETKSLFDIVKLNLNNHEFDIGEKFYLPLKERYRQFLKEDSTKDIFHDVNIFYISTHLLNIDGKLGLQSNQQPSIYPSYKFTPPKWDDNVHYELKKLIDLIVCMGIASSENGQQTHSYLILDACGGSKSIDFVSWVKENNDKINGSFSMITTSSTQNETYICKKNKMPCATCTIIDAFKEEFKSEADYSTIPNARIPARLIPISDGALTFEELFKYMENRLPYYLNQNNIPGKQKVYFNFTTPPQVVPYIFEFNGASIPITLCEY